MVGNFKYKDNSNILVMAFGLMLVFLLITVYNNAASANVTPLIYIPIVYVILFVFALKIVKFISTPGLLVVNALYFIRYFLLPIGLVSYYSDSYLQIYKTGTWLLLYEEFFAFVAYFIYLNHRKPIINRELNRRNFSSEIKVFDKIFAVLFFISVIIYLIKPSVFESYNFIANVGSELVEEVSERKESAQASSLDTLFYMITFVTYLMIPAYFALHLYSFYIRKPTSLNFYITIFIPLMISSLFIVETDRGGVVHRVATMIFYFVRLFPQKSNKIMKITYLPIAILVLYMIASRMLGNDEDVNLSGDDTNVLLIGYLQAYVAHIVNCTDALTAFAKYADSANFLTPINDILGNIPVLNHISDSHNSCKFFYDSTINRTDQVLPLVGNGLFYFGYVFSPLLSFITIKFLLKVDEIYQKETNPLGIYVYAYIAIQLAFCHYQNVQLIFLYLTNMIAPIWIVFKLVKMYGKKTNIVKVK